MDNQHKLIKGYRDLNETEIRLINTIKSIGTKCEILIASLELTDADSRWIEIGKTHLQEGISALVRSVAKPQGF